MIDAVSCVHSSPSQVGAAVLRQRARRPGKS
jgi:hypothetical protein